MCQITVLQDHRVATSLDPARKVFRPCAAPTRNATVEAIAVEVSELMPWHYGPGFGWLGALMMVVMMLLFWGGLFAVVVVVLRHFASGSFRQHNAERLLDERLARGEIDETQYTKLRGILHPH